MEPAGFLLTSLRKIFPTLEMIATAVASKTAHGSVWKSRIVLFVALALSVSGTESAHGQPAQVGIC